MSYYNINIYSVLKEFIIEEKIWIEEEHHTTTVTTTVVEEYHADQSIPSQYPPV